MPTTVSVAPVRTPSVAPVVLASTTVAVGGLGVGLLVAGTASSESALLAWGAVLCLVTVGISVVAALRVVIEDAMERSVARMHAVLLAEVNDAVSSTAVKVGEAIAEILSDDDPRPPASRPGVRSLH